MRTMIRKATVLAIVLVLIVGICAPAFAVVYPSARLVTARSRSVYRGGTLRARYYLKCGSFSYRNGYRAQLETAVFRNSTGRRYAFREINYTGNGYFNHDYTIGYSTPRGQYNMRMRSYYRNYYYSNWRMCGKTVWWYMHVK